MHTGVSDRLMKQAKLLAFLLPQFHRIPENDAWWGEGFTEWTNVRRAQPLFPGHLQPRVPLENRYYDLSDPSVHDWQAELAQSHGIDGFCYYHYWFNGTRLLEQPFEIMLARGKPDMPFCLAWANEPWTRAWDGGDREVLMPQDYGGEQDWQRHFDYLLRAFRDPRYIRVDGKPMFLIYRSASIHGCEDMLRLWRRQAEQAGLPGLHLVSMLTHFAADARQNLFDAFVEFEPLYTIHYDLPYWVARRERLMKKWTRFKWRWLGRADRAPNSYSYVDVWKRIAQRSLRPNHYPGAFADWDNSPRRGLHRSLIMRDFQRRTFAEGIASQIRKARHAQAEFVFINAWNEWAEGTYLEPDTARGKFFLEAIRAAVNNG